MHISSTEFVKSVRGTDAIMYDGTPQILFVGRSNVGKSSTINAILGRKDLVRASKTPGHTQTLNFFVASGKFARGDTYYIVDAPGYGFTRLSQKQTERLQKMLVWYLTESDVKPLCVVSIVDAKVGLTEQDRTMLTLLRDEGHQAIVVANKIDKLKRSERAKALAAIEEQCAPFDVFPISAKEKEGVGAVQDVLFGVTPKEC